MQIEIFDFISSKFHPCTIHQSYPSVPASSSPRTCIWRTLREYPSSLLINTLHKHGCCHLQTAAICKPLQLGIQSPQRILSSSELVSMCQCSCPRYFRGSPQHNPTF